MPQTAPRASDFEEKVKSLGLVFKPPEGYQVVPPKENRDMKYDYALRNSTKEYEVRYALQPIPKGMLEEYKQWSEKKDKGDDVMTDPNLRFEMVFRAILANVAGKGDIGPSQHFPTESVKAEFGGDSGIMAPLEMNSQFGGDFKRCVVVGIHKTDFGEIYIFHLYNDEDTVREFNPVFYSLRFPIEKDAAKPNQ